MNIHLYSLHGLFRGVNPEIGRDADNGGQIVYVLELARHLSRHPAVGRVTLFARRVDDPRLDAGYAEPVEVVNEKFTIQRIPFGGPAYLPKEQLWPHLDEFVRATLDHVAATGNVPDVVHGHYADAARAAARIAESLEVPLLQTGHSLGRPKLARLIADGMPEAVAMEQFRFTERFAAEDLSLEQARFIITSSNQEILTYQGYPHAGKARYEVIPPGIDFNRFRPHYEAAVGDAQVQARLRVEERLSRFLRDPRKPLIVALCRADRKKNLASLVEAYGSDPTLQALANLAVFPGLRDDISRMNPAPRAVLEDLLLLQDRHNLYGRLAIPKRHDPVLEVPELYRLAADRHGVFVNVALTEPFGLTLLEAAASGLPVVATNDGGPAEIVPTCGNGILVDPVSIPAIQAALRKLLTDEEAWLACSQSGIRQVRKHYSWDRHVERYVRLVSEVLNSQ